MKLKLFLLLTALFLTVEYTYSQVSITNVSPVATIDFSNTMQTSVGTSPSTAYEGDGFQPNPTTAGRLNSNAWEVQGFSYGTLLFGGTQTVDDFGRGSVTGGVITTGIYAFTESPGTVANPSMMIQPGVGDFDPGTITLRIRNNGTTNLTQLTIAYNLFVRNDENTSSSFNFSHSNDNLVFVSEPLLDYISPDVADAFQWNNIGLSPSRDVTINGLNIAPGGFYFVKWSSFLVSGVGASDEFGLDDIVVTGVYGAPAPEINVTAYGNTVLSGDITPTVAEGTEFAPIGSPISTLLSSQSITYYIQNLGGLTLNISSVTITGLHPTDFTVFIGPQPVGSIAPASATITERQLTIVFDPSAAGLRRARVNIFSDDANENPYFFDVQGYGIIPIPDIRVNGGPIGGGLSIVTNGSLVPNAFNNTLYSTQVIGGAGEIKNFIIRNDCPQNAPVILTNASPYVTIGGLNPADFTLTTIPLGNNINPGFTRSFAIRFLPTGGGIRSALVTIPNNDPDENPFTFLIQGNGVSPEMDVNGNSQPIVSGGTITSFVNHTFFDYLNINTGSLDRTYTIRNSGTLALTLGALTITGPQASDYSVVSAPLPASLAIGASVTFTIRFNPTAVGLRDAIITIVNNDLNESPYIFDISGYGLDYTPCTFGILETIAIQDFETVPATPTWTYGTTGISSVTNGTAFGASGDAGLSDKFLGLRSLQISNSIVVATLASINTLTYSDIELNLRLASLGLTALDGNDVTDKVTVSISSNGGATYSNEIEIVGNTEAKWNFTSGTGVAYTSFDGDNIPTNINPLSGGYLTTNGYSTISISDIPKVASLIVRITISNNASEIWAIDNVTLFGRKESVTTWNGATWSNGVPTSSVKAVIDGNYNTAAFGNIDACKCTINAGRNVIINTNGFFNVESDLSNSGNILIEDGGSLVQRNDFAVNNGSFTVKRFSTPMVKFDYSYWSSPVTGQSLFGFSPLTRVDKFFQYNPIIGNWVGIPGSTIMLPAKGYIMRSPDNFDLVIPQQYTAGEFIGLANNGFIQTPISVGISNMNLIGNPYPSAISANSFLSFTANTGVVEGTIYLWTHNTPITGFVYNSNDFAVYNFSGSISTRASLSSGVNTTTPSGKIASGQGFFIKGLANGQATFNNSMRLTTGNNEFFRMFNDDDLRTNSGFETNRVWLNLTNSQGAFKQTLVGYIEGATNDYDRGYDGETLNGNTYLNLYSILEDKNLSIQGKSIPFIEQDKVILGYNVSIAGNFQIEIDKVDGLLEAQNIYLEDKLLNVIHDLKQIPYTFYSEIGTFNNRFELRYNTETLNTNNFYSNENDLFVAVKDKKIDVLSKNKSINEITIYDLLGRTIFEANNLNTKNYSINNVVMNQQTLIVKIKLENGEIVTKKIIL